MIGATKSFRSEVDGDGVATITLDRPDRINSLTFEVYGELRDTFRWLKENGPEVRADRAPRRRSEGLLLRRRSARHHRRFFSRDMQGLLEFTRMTGALVQAIRTTRPPVVAALHGVVCGAGAVIAAACDIRIGAKDTRFAYLFPKVGLCGADMGAAYLLPRLVGMGRATEILLTGDWVPAEEAHRIGLLNRVVEVEALRDEADAFARKLAKGPAFAHAMTKRMLEYEAHVDFATAIEAEAQAQAICMQHPDFLEAHEAWKEKRAPRYR
ncbi:MAG: enoyl-CoA hydratase-related protein [Polyangiales bacterium]